MFLNHIIIIIIIIIIIMVLSFKDYDML